MLVYCTWKVLHWNSQCQYSVIVIHTKGRMSLNLFQLTFLATRRDGSQCTLSSVQHSQQSSENNSNGLVHDHVMRTCIVHAHIFNCMRTLIIKSSYKISITFIAAQAISHQQSFRCPQNYIWICWSGQCGKLQNYTTLIKHYTSIALCTYVYIL